MREYYYAVQRSSDYLAHYGVKGMKWGVRKEKEKSPGYHRIAAKLKKSTKAKPVNRESDFVRSSGNLAINKKAMHDISKAFKDHDFSSLVNSARQYSDARNKLNSSFSEYSKKLVKKRKGKLWDGDGTEEHWALEKNFPAYAKISKAEKSAQMNFLDEVDRAVKSGKFDNIRGRNISPNYIEKIGRGNDRWYRKADSRSYAIASVALQKANNDSKSLANKYEILPEYFINSYDKRGKRFTSYYDYW